MRDRERLQKLLNLCSSANDAEALAALRLAQNLAPMNLGDLLVNSGQSESEKLQEEHLGRLYESEVEKLRSQKQLYAALEKKLHKRERDLMRLKRENKDLTDRIEEAQKQLQIIATSAAKSQNPSEYQILEQLYEQELFKNDKLQLQLAEKDRSLKKGMRDVGKLKRDKGKSKSAGENRIEELEKMVNDLALEVMDYRDRGRARSTLKP